MQTTVILFIISAVGTIISGLCVYILNSFKKAQEELSEQIKILNQKLDDLKQRYYENTAGYSKLFVSKQERWKTQIRITKRLQRIQQYIDDQRN